MTQVDNMATTPNIQYMKMDISRNLIPEIYQGEGDIEEFITECQRYFQLCGLQREQQGIMVQCLISRDLIPIYAAVEERNQGFEEKLREAFKKPTSLIGDFMELYKYEKNQEAAPVFFDKVDKLVTKLMKHKWDKNELLSYFLVHCIKDNSIRRELKLRDAKKPEEIMEVIKKLDSIELEVSSMAVIQRKETFSEVVRKRQDFADRHREKQDNRYLTPKHTVERHETARYNGRNFAFRSEGNAQRRNEYDQRNRYSGEDQRTCWNCQERGHISQNCRKRAVRHCFSCGKEGHMSRECEMRRQRCYACKEEGHRREECPSISCTLCRRKGHLRYQCSNDGYQDAGRRNNSYLGFQRSAGGDDRRGGRVAAIESDDDRLCDDSGKQKDYPNAEASTLGEMIGAMQ